MERTNLKCSWKVLTLPSIFTYPATTTRFRYEIIYIVSNIRQTMNTKLFFTAIAIAATFSIAVTAVATPVSAQNTTDGNLTGGNMTMSADGNMTSMGNNLTMEMDDKYTAGG